jgi:hypothetical protein
MPRPLRNIRNGNLNPDRAAGNKRGDIVRPFYKAYALTEYIIVKSYVLHTLRVQTVRVEVVKGEAAPLVLVYNAKGRACNSAPVIQPFRKAAREYGFARAKLPAQANYRAFVYGLRKVSGEVYAAVYRCSPCFKRVTDYMADKIERVIDIAKELGGPVTFLGDGVPPHRELLTQAGFDTAHANNTLQRAASVGVLAIDLINAGEAAEPRGFKIFYIRKPQAERELEQKNV